MALGGGDFRRDLGHGNGVLTNGVGILIKETPERALGPSQGKYDHMTTCEPESGLEP